MLQEPELTKADFKPIFSPFPINVSDYLGKALMFLTIKSTLLKTNKLM